MNVDLNIAGERLFRSEPRDEKWAPERERELATLLASAAKGASATVDDFECRQFICRVITSGPPDGVFIHPIEKVFYDDGAEMLMYDDLSSGPERRQIVLYMEYPSRDGARNPRESP